MLRGLDLDDHALVGLADVVDAAAQVIDRSPRVIQQDAALARIAADPVPAGRQRVGEVRAPVG